MYIFGELTSFFFCWSFFRYDVNELLFFPHHLFPGSLINLLIRLPSCLFHTRRRGSSNFAPSKGASKAGSASLKGGTSTGSRPRKRKDPLEAATEEEKQEEERKSETDNGGKEGERERERGRRWFRWMREDELRSGGPHVATPLRQ